MKLVVYETGYKGLISERQLHTLKATHPGLADTASRAIAALRRGVLEELP